MEANNEEAVRNIDELLEEIKKPEYDARRKEIADNLDEVREKIRTAAVLGGRDPQKVQLCAVSKTKPATDILLAREGGQQLFGENYVQEINQKFEALGDAVTWHMIGHLQKNKVKYLVGKTAMIHSVDSVGLAQEVQKQAAKHGAVMDILLEVNAAGEETKFGFTPAEVPAAAEEIEALPNVKLRGLMTSAPFTEDGTTNRPYFQTMRKLFEELQAKYGADEINTLSMGMTADYETAVEEGATIVRVGTGIFGARDYSKKK